MKKIKRYLSLIMIIIFLVSTLDTFETEAASYKEIYVLSKITFPYIGPDWEYIYSYNKKGFLTKEDQRVGDFSGYRTYKYNSSNNIKQVYVHSGNVEDYTEKYTYKNGNMVKRKYTIEDDRCVYKYKWKKNHIVKETQDRSSGYHFVTNYKLDFKGNVIKEKTNNGNGITYKYYTLTYKKGRVASKTTDGNTMKYYYKKIKVPKKNIAKIKKQQWCLVNGFK